MAVTMRDVAKASGISIATISKYYNGVKVKEASREAIEAAATALGYTPNLRARALKTNKSYTVGLIFADIKYYFSGRIYPFIESTLTDHGYSLLMYECREDGDVFMEKLEYMISQDIEGLIVMTYAIPPKAMELLRANGIPLVLLENYIPGLVCDTVLVDNLNSSYAAIEKMINAGHREIGIILGPEGTYTADERLKGYLRAFEDYNLPNDRRHVSYGDYTVSSGYSRTVDLLTSPQPPTALLVTNHELTVGAAMACMRLDLKIPQQLEFVGFDVEDFSHDIFPRLPMILQPFQELGRQIANILILRINGDETLYPITLRLKAQNIAPGLN